MRARGIQRVATRDEVPSSAGGRRCELRRPGARDEALAQLGRGLGFPSWYGGNLDAAWDCLTDISDPVQVLWTGWQDFAVHHPVDWADLVSLFRDRADEGSDFNLYLVDA